MVIYASVGIRVMAGIRRLVTGIRLIRCGEEIAIRMTAGIRVMAGIRLVTGIRLVRCGEEVAIHAREMVSCVVARRCVHEVRWGTEVCLDMEISNEAGCENSGTMLAACVYCYVAAVD